MRKKTRLLLLAGVMVGSVIAITQKPNETDFASWMEETYEVQCLDEVCDVFQLETGKEQIIMQTVQGGFSPGIFMARMHKTYRNHDDPSYHLELKASGFLKNIRVERKRYEGCIKGKVVAIQSC